VDGPVVYIYDGLLRREALILSSAADSAGAGHVRRVQLDVSESELSDKAGRFMALVGLEPDDTEPDPADPAAQSELLGILGWLRERVTGPVLAAIGYDRFPVGERQLPRIWWCPVGVISSCRCTLLPGPGRLLLRLHRPQPSLCPLAAAAVGSHGE
jgi:hypothetical protein